MTTYLWLKTGCILALVAWEFAKGVARGMREGR